VVPDHNKQENHLPMTRQKGHLLLQAQPTILNAFHAFISDITHYISLQFFTLRAQKVIKFDHRIEVRFNGRLISPSNIRNSHLEVITSYAEC